MSVHRRIRPGIESLRAKIGLRLAAARGYASSIFPLGITARLTISLAAVTVLAATANMIAQQSGSVVRFALRPSTVAIRYDAPIPLLPIPPPAPKAIEEPLAPPKPIVDRQQIDALTIEIDRFERASELRATANSETGDAEFNEAARALRHTAASFGRNSNGSPSRAPGTSAAAAVSRRAVDYLDGGTELVAAADARRAAHAGYARRSESIGQRIQTSLDTAWKIFGRVIARQSLLQLRTNFDALLHSSTGFTGGEVLSASQLTPIMENETVFAATLASNRAGLVKAEGLPWVQGLEDDFRELVDLRQQIVALNARYDTAHSEFTRQHVQLSGALLTASTTMQATLQRRQPAPSASIVPAAEPSPATATSPTADTSPTDALDAGTGASAGDLVTETTSVDRRARNVMGVVTAIVMLIILVISILTVRSVLAPVRRIIKATARLADGDAHVEVSRGGIRELDALAGTFNDMAAKLAAARKANRTHQENLEEKVRERTHKLQQLAEQDPLTSLPNRRHLTGLLNATLERAAQNDRRVGVYFIDVDNFKNFNDSLGHVFGDRVLMSVANRLEETTEGFGYVARLGGDEFTFVYEAADSVEAIERMGAELVQAFQSLVTVDERDLRISVSVGASIFPDHERDAEGLLRAADSALFRAKELGRNQLAVFTPELIESAAARFTTEQGLRGALERGEFELVYQPEINLATLEVELVEALLRWRMPDGRIVRPGAFLPVAEQSGLITEISKWVLRTAVQSASRWHFGGWPEACVAINISPRQLLDHAFIDQLTALLDEFRLPKECVELELTETVLQTGPTTIAALRALQARGFAIALDDFGTGYSSLTSLQHLPLSRIKLDRGLIESVDTSARAAAIVRAILDLCAGLGLAVTAEGIERPEQLAWLAANRSLFVQGYLFSKGLAFDEVLPARPRLLAEIQDLLLSTPPNVQRLSAPTPAPAADERNTANG